MGVKGETFGDVVDRVKGELKKEGFGVLAEIDIQNTLRSKIGVETPRHLILAARNPKLAHQAISAEPDIGLLLPCNVVVREDELGDIFVSAIRPTALFELVANARISEIATDVENRLGRALRSTAEGVHPEAVVQLP